MKNLLKSRRSFKETFAGKGSLGGFTIIEILIVLAIAGLILTIVFVAVPQLQRNTRDSKRQSIATRISTELQAYASNNGGTFPFATSGGTFPGTNCKTVSTTQFSCYDFWNRYINNKVDTNDPRSGGPANMYMSTATGTPTPPVPWDPTRMIIGPGRLCNGEAFSTTAGSGAGASAKDFAILTALERDSTWYCIDNG